MSLTDRSHPVQRRLGSLVLIACFAVAWSSSGYTETPESRSSLRADVREGTVDVEALLARFEDEPSVRDVQRAARRHGRHDETALEHGRARARWSNLVPVVDGELAWLARNGTEWNFQEDLATTDDGDFRHDEASNEYADDENQRRSYSLELEFDLRGLVFDESEIDVVRERREQRRARSERVVEVTKLYFERRKRQVRRLLTPRDEWRKRLKLALAIRRYTARIDALTGGWFSSRLDSQPGERP
jgi:hypothetical protein